jgi:hypothetical protein
MPPNLDIMHEDGLLNAIIWLLTLHIGSISGIIDAIKTQLKKMAPICAEESASPTWQSGACYCLQLCQDWTASACCMWSLWEVAPLEWSLRASSAISSAQ